MPAAIWLRPEGRQERALQRLIDDLAAAHGTPAFAPHLTVCGVPDLDVLDAAAALAGAAALPLTVAKTAVTSAAITPLQAVFIAVEESPQLREFRERLRAVTGAPPPDPPHISLLYALDRLTQRPRPDLDAARLAAIAEDCAARLGDIALVLGRPVVVAPDRDWTDVRSWRVIRVLSQ